MKPLLGRPAVLVSAAGGALLMLAFPPYGLWPLAPVAVALLSLAVHGRRARAAVWQGMVFGLAYFVPLLWWVGSEVGPVPALILSVFEALFCALMGPALAAVQRLRLWPVWAACLWVGQEYLRGRLPFGGFPWGRLGFSQGGSPYTSFAAYGGVALLSFAVALSGTLLARLAISPPRSVRPAVLGLAGLVAVPAVGLLGWLGVASPTGGPTAQVAVVQGNVPRLGLDFNAQRRAVLDNHVTRTLELAARIDAGQVPRPAYVVWPENSSDIDPYLNPDAAAEIDRAARAVRVPILVGAVLVGPGDKLRNAGIVWDPVTGPGQTYVKRHPVPFGEYIPLRSIARKVSKDVDRVRNDFVAGDRVGTLDVAGTVIGDVICFEIAYDGLVRDVVDGGAQVLVVQTNNATFDRSGETYQQLAMSRVRAVEYGRTVLVAATSGVSAVIAPDGSVVERSEIFTPDVLSYAAPERTGRTLAARLGAVPEQVLAAAGLLAWAAASWLRRRSGKMAASSDEPTGEPTGTEESGTEEEKETV